MEKILIVGNPNSGKTTLFNSLANANEKVGNWHGVTVENKEKEIELFGEKFCFVDTAGIYSLNTFSFEEEVTLNALKKDSTCKILNVCDVSNLRINLFLTLQLLEKGFDLTLIINKKKRKIGAEINLQKLSKLLRVEVVEINAKKKIDEKFVKKMQKSDKKHEKIVIFGGNEEEKAKNRYKHVDEILRKCDYKTHENCLANKIDKVVLNKFFAIPIFLSVMCFVFFFTFFSVGSFLSNMISIAFQFLENCVLEFFEDLFGGGIFFEFLDRGLLAGVSVVLSFLPQICLLLFFLSILEESGYLSRLAFLFDDLLSKVGLSGKSVYSLLMGCGCSTSAILTTRGTFDKNERTKTAMLCPYMSCTAKLPIYVVVGGVFFGKFNLFVIVGLYFLSIFVCVLVANFFNKTCLKSEKKAFLLEFSDYHQISPFWCLKTLWGSATMFLKKIGLTLIFVNMIFWFFSSFSVSLEYVGSAGGSIMEMLGKFLTPIFTPLGFGGWAIVCSLLAGIVAKEVVLSTFAIFNGVEENSFVQLGQSFLCSESPIFFDGTASVLSFLVFFMFYFPCASSISVLAKEIGAKWTFISIITQFFVAYVLSFAVYHGAVLCQNLNLQKIFVIFVVLFCVFVIFRKKKGGCKGCKNLHCSNH